MSEARIWKPGGFVDADGFEPLEEGATVTSTAIVPLKVFAALDDAQKAVVRAIRVEPDDDVAMLDGWLEKLSLIAVSFPAFSDGRAFSQATLLRDRSGFTGEIRAVGDVLIDQVAYMIRCGIDSVAVDNAVAIARLEQGRLGAVPEYYQPTVQDAPHPGGYSWRRQSAAS